MLLTQKCSTTLIRIFRPITLSLAVMLILTPLVALAEQPIVAKLDVNQSGRTMTAELHFDLGGGNLNGHVDLDVHANPASQPKRQSSTTMGRFKVRIDLLGTYNGGLYGIMSGTARISGTFIDDANCEATLDGIGTFNGSVSGPLGLAQIEIDCENIEFKGCNMISPQPLSAMLPPFTFEKTEVNPTSTELGNETGNASMPTGASLTSNATASIPIPKSNIIGPGGQNPLNSQSGSITNQVEPGSSNLEGNAQGGCYKDPMTGTITCVDSNGNPINTQSGSKTNQLAPSSSVPRSLDECETYTSEICGTWTMEGNHINAVWNNGATATLNVESWSPAGAVLTRYDSGGSSAGLSARYEGQITGNKIENGKVTWNWKGSTWSGTWKANW
jgi:hypothetical protein